MNKVIISILALSGLVWMSCNSNGPRYVDLNTGEEIELRDSSGIMVNAANGELVELYVDTKTNDTIYGRTGKVVNGSVRRNNSDRWIYIDADANAARSDDNGDVKVQYEDGETKIKSGDYKKEVEKDGDITIKDGDTKIKIDGKTGERKVKKDD